MKKKIMLVGLAMLLASPAFAQAPAGGYGSGNIIYPGNPAAAAAAGASSTILQGAPGGAFLGVPSGAAGAYAFEPATSQECAKRFKSYDPRSGMYLGRDGLRHACP
jgi:BA14K-like protein